MNEILIPKKLVPVVQDARQGLIETKQAWGEEEGELVGWFLSTSSLPTEPFQLNGAVRVCDPLKFYAYLRENISCGSKGVRARFGALQQDLRDLKDLFSD